jgi:deaminated glutathione amidase
MTTALSSAADKVPVAAIAQLRSTSNKLENLVNVARCAHMAKEKGACMLFLPECFGFIGESSEQTLANAERPIDDKDQVKNSDEITTILSNTVQDVSAANNIQGSIADTTAVGLLDGLQTIARESQLWLSCGGMHCLGAPANESGEARVYNTHIIIDNHGALKAVYQKIHLFDVSIPGKFTLRESATTAPGTKLVVCDSPIGKLGLATCYDMRFPEMFEPLVQAGAQVLLFPSAFTVPTGKAHWHTLLRGKGWSEENSSCRYGTT